MAIQMLSFFNGKPKPIGMGGAKSPSQQNWWNFSIVKLTGS